MRPRCHEASALARPEIVRQHAGQRNHSQSVEATAQKVSAGQERVRDRHGRDFWYSVMTKNLPLPKNLWVDSGQIKEFVLFLQFFTSFRALEYGSQIINVPIWAIPGPQ